VRSKCKKTAANKRFLYFSGQRRPWETDRQLFFFLLFFAFRFENIPEALFGAWAPLDA
jgi:hypothetical protein